jgi:hypothetical protein
VICTSGLSSSLDQEVFRQIHRGTVFKLNAERSVERGLTSKAAKDNRHSMCSMPPRLSSCPGAVLTVALVLTGCGHLAPKPAAPSTFDAADLACHAEFIALDAETDREGTRDAEADRIEGFPGLRVNRLLVALAQRAAHDDDAFAAWIERARQLDAEAREVELAQRPGGAPAPTQERIEACSQRLAKAVRDDPASRPVLLDRARVPDRYSLASRALGLYPLTRVPFFDGVQQWQREQTQVMREVSGRLQPVHRVGPAGVDRAVQPPSTLPRDALGLPQPGADQVEALLARHAPRFDIEANGAFDAIGVPTRHPDGRVGVDASQPVVYQRLTYTLVQGRALLQLVYTAWFDQRPQRGAFDLLAGALDGVIVRLTLGPDGRPLMLDTIHACGCYQLFFPGHGVQPRPDAPRDEEWAFAPARLPEIATGQRLAVRLASGTHDVLGVSAVDADEADERYARRPESDLRRLPDRSGATRSLYGPDGLVRGSERAERFVFWPMGIASAGAMRQWGHHATAFVGRRHFDDADLLDRRFEFAPLN